MINWQKNNDGWETKLSNITLIKNMVYIPYTLTIGFNMFKEHRGSGYDVLYWTHTVNGPGRHKTTYTIWNS
jgi:hypothetical protein